MSINKEIFKLFVKESLVPYIAIFGSIYFTIHPKLIESYRFLKNEETAWLAIFPLVLWIILNCYIISKNKGPQILEKVFNEKAINFLSWWHKSATTIWIIFIAATLFKFSIPSFILSAHCLLFTTYILSIHLFNPSSPTNKNRNVNMRKKEEMN